MVKYYNRSITINRLQLIASKKFVLRDQTSILKGAKLTRSSSKYALPLFNPVPELSGLDLASKCKDFEVISSSISQKFL